MVQRSGVSLASTTRPSTLVPTSLSLPRPAAPPPAGRPAPCPRPTRRRACAVRRRPLAMHAAPLVLRYDPPPHDAPPAPAVDVGSGEVLIVPAEAAAPAAAAESPAPAPAPALRLALHGAPPAGGGAPAPDTVTLVCHGYGDDMDAPLMRALAGGIVAAGTAAGGAGGGPGGGAPGGIHVAARLDFRGEPPGGGEGRGGGGGRARPSSLSRLSLSPSPSLLSLSAPPHPRPPRPPPEGNGGSGGDFEFGNYRAEARDVERACRALARRFGGAAVTGVVGHSKGASSVLLWAAEGCPGAAADVGRAAGADDPPPPCRVVLLAGRFDLARGVEERFGAAVVGRVRGQPGWADLPRPRGPAGATWRLTRGSLEERLGTDLAAAASRVDPTVCRVLTARGRAGGGAAGRHAATLLPRSPLYPSPEAHSASPSPLPRAPDSRIGGPGDSRAGEGGAAGGGVGRRVGRARRRPRCGVSPGDT